MGWNRLQANEHGPVPTMPSESPGRLTNRRSAPKHPPASFHFRSILRSFPLMFDAGGSSSILIRRQTTSVDATSTRPECPRTEVSGGYRPLLFIVNQIFQRRSRPPNRATPTGCHPSSLLVSLTDWRAKAWHRTRPERGGSGFFGGRAPEVFRGVTATDRRKRYQNRGMESRYAPCPQHEQRMAFSDGRGHTVVCRRTVLTLQKENLVYSTRSMTGWPPSGADGAYDAGSVYEAAKKKGDGHRVRSRSLPNQQAEVGLACKILNTMTSLGRPDSYRVM